MHSLTHTKHLATASTERWLAPCFAFMASSHPTELLKVSHHSHPRDFCRNRSTETATDGLTSPKIFALFNPKTVLCVIKAILHHAAMQDQPTLCKTDPRPGCRIEHVVLICPSSSVLSRLRDLASLKKRMFYPMDVFFTGLTCIVVSFPVASSSSSTDIGSSFFHRSFAHINHLFAQLRWLA